MDLKVKGDERKLLAEGTRVVSDGRATRIYDVETGVQIPYVTRFTMDIRANPKRHVSVTLEIDVPRVEYDGPADLIARLWPTDEMLAEASESDAEDPDAADMSLIVRRG